MSSEATWRTPLLVIIAGCAIATIGFGIRSTLGLFLEPMTFERAWTRETYALALAIQNLFWGLGLPLAGMLADKFGSFRVIVIGTVLYAIGIYGMSIVETPVMLHLFAGVLAGTGIAFSAFSLALAAMVRVVGPEKRSMILGLGTAASSFGMVLFTPLSQGFIQSAGWSTALLWLSMIALSMIPLAFVLPRVGAGSNVLQSEQTLKAAVTEALGHRGYVLLTTGFFVCGFHVAFITVHFPAYVRDIGLDPKIGAYAIALIGLFNIAGSFAAGFIGQHYSKKLSLSAIYFARAIAIMALLLLPKTPLLIYGFAAVMGVLWLSTVPLTTGIIAQVFGVRYMSTLFGIVFLSHQLGSFLGVWLGGLLHDLSGSYNSVWWTGVVLAVVSAVVHLPINEKPLPRMQIDPLAAQGLTTH